MPSFGAKLKLQREQRGVTLEEISLSTKIGSRFLRALEDDHFEQLPGGIFNKGFVRAYARSVGMDEEEAVASYLAATGASPDKPEPSLPLPEVHAEPSHHAATDLPWGALAVVLLVAALGLVIWGFRNRETQKSQRTPPAQQVNTVPRTVLAPAPTPATLTSTAAPNSPAVTAKSEPPSPLAPTAKADMKPVSASTHPVGLQIKAREDSWISITVDGEVMMRDTMTAGTQKSIHASREITVKAGNIGALDFELNGKTLPSQGNIGEVRTLVFDTSGFHLAPSPPVAPEASPQ